jgi:hypothetical protein
MKEGETGLPRSMKIAIGVVVLVGAGLSMWELGYVNKETPAETASRERRAIYEENVRAVRQICREGMENRLRAPSTAKFQPTSQFTVIQGRPADDQIPASLPESLKRRLAHTDSLVFGHVDAQNSFGAMIRTEFVCLFSGKSGSWRLDDIVTSP